MSSRVKHRIEFGFLAAGLILANLAVRGIQAGGRQEEIPIHCYGGMLSPGTRAALAGMNRDFHDAREVWSIGSRRVLIEDGKGAAREYYYSGSTLWLNRQPLVSRVRSLHFEFRDEWGNLLTHRSGNCVRVHTIVTTLRFTDRPSEIFVNSRTTLPLKRSRPEPPARLRIAYGRPE